MVLVTVLDGQTFGYLPIRDTYLARGSPHRLEPRRIIPGQQLHGSVLYADAYKPRAMLGEGLDIRTIHTGLEDVEHGDQIWETGLFDFAAYLSSWQVAPESFDKLLLVLRSSTFPSLFDPLD